MSNSGNLIEKYGVSGSTMFSIWEGRLKEIKKMQSFGSASPADTDAHIHQLKLEIIGEFRKNIGKEIKSGRVFWVCVAAAIVDVIILGAAGSAVNVGPFAIAFLACILAAIYVKKGWQKNLEKFREAVVDFDEQYFDGEIMFKWKNGVEI